LFVSESPSIKFWSRLIATTRQIAGAMPERQRVCSIAAFSAQRDSRKSACVTVVALPMPSSLIV
jgi:hypothetical protein